jgi:hypothetical protein
MAAAMITVTKTFTYRGEAELWSGSYHLTDHPVDPTAWGDLAGAISVWERPCFTADVVPWAYLGYENSDDPSVWGALASDLSISVPGTLAVGSDQYMAGDQASTFGIKTGLFSTKGKPIWLRKYFHGGVVAAADPADYIGMGLNSALSDFTAHLIDDEMGLTSGDTGSPIYYADKSGRRPDGPARVDSFVTTRTLERRGKRPH